MTYAFARRMLGAVLRLPLRAIPRSARLPILTGPARGMRWRVGSATHGCWIGTYERETQTVLRRSLSAGMVMYDVGAHVGFYTMLASRLVGDAGRVIAFEPLPENARHLALHVADNGITNAQLIEAAVSDVSGMGRFALGGASTMGHVAANGELVVKFVQLDEMVTAGMIPTPHCMKIDVEGAELTVLHGALRMLRSARPALVLATHGYEIRMACVELLGTLGYEVVPLESDKHTLIATPGSGTR